MENEEDLKQAEDVGWKLLREHILKCHARAVKNLKTIQADITLHKLQNDKEGLAYSLELERIYKTSIQRYVDGYSELFI